MIDIKQAVSSAKQFAREAIGANDFLLEEVRSDDAQFHITLSFPHRLSDAPAQNPLLKNLRNAPREFKTFDVDKQTGEVLAMAIREL